MDTWVCLLRCANILFMRSLFLKQPFLSVFVASLVFSASFLVADFAYAVPDLPSKCPGTIADYNIVDVSLGQTASGSNDFIFAGDNNSTPIDGRGGSDCILIGNGNTVDVSGNGNDDFIIVGNTNSGEIRGKGGNDTIVVGENNTGNISGEGGNDTIVDGYGSTGIINGGGGVDLIVHVPPAPSANPLPGTFNSTQEITLSSDGAASIFYTTDGTIPDCQEENGELYESPFPILSTKNVKAIACTEEGYGSPVASFNYTIELKTDSVGLASVLEAVFVPASGESLSLTQSLTVSQDLEINTTASGSKVILEEATVITRADDQPFDATTLTSSETDIGLLAGLTEGQIFEAALQWGIASISLNFDRAITINIFVGTALNGQTLNVNRSVTGIDGWTTDGIVPPATCLVADGICSFQATKASVYAAITEPPAPTPTPTPTPSSGGGGGSIWFPQLYNPTPSSVETKPIESPVPLPLAGSEISSPTPLVTPVVKTALAPKPKMVISKNTQKNIVPKKNNEVAIISTAVSENTKKSFVFSVFASVGRLFFYPFSFWK